MHSNHFYFAWVSIFLIAGCATRYDANVSSADDQCRILNKKRHTAQRAFEYKKKNLSRHKETARVPLPRSASEEPIVFITPHAVSPLAPDRATMSASISSGAWDSYSLAQIQSPDKQSSSLSYTLPLPQTKASVPNVAGIEPSPVKVTRLSSPGAEGITNNAVPVLVATGGFMSILLLSAARRRSKDLSRWASQNSWKARGLILGGHVATGLSAVALGSHLSDGGMTISEVARYGACLAFGTSFLLYPSRGRTSPYLMRKIHDAVLFTSGTVLMIYAGNQYVVTQQLTKADNKPLYNATAPFQRENAIYVIRKQVSAAESIGQDVPRKKSTAAKIGLTILALAVFAGLGYVLAGVSCSIACSGSEGLAMVLFVGGATGLIILLIRTIRSIFRKGRKRDKKTSVLQAT